MDKDNKPQPIDVGKIISILWSKRKTYLKVLSVVFVGVYLYMCTLPRYYQCELELAPESNSSNLSSLGSLASSIGLSRGGNVSAGADAISPLLYPDLFKSEQFLVKLFSIQVETADGRVNTTYYDYLCNHQKSSLLSEYVLNPILALFPKKEPKSSLCDSIDIKHLSKREQLVVQRISKKLKCKIDRKTSAISITAIDQDPEVCATIGNEVLQKIQEFIVEYRTKKAYADYDHYKQVTARLEQEYEEAMKQYVDFADSHRNAQSQETMSRRESLQLELQRRSQLYTNMQMQLQAAEARIQENKPAFTAIRTAVAPFKPAGPKRLVNALVVTILSFIILSAFLLFASKKTSNK